MGQSEHHVLNSKNFAEEMTEIIIEENEVFNSHDVVSLFTNVPIPQALDVVRQYLTNDTTFKTRTLLTVDDVMTLLEFVLTSTYFSFRVQIYQQRFGTAMHGQSRFPHYRQYIHGIPGEASHTHRCFGM